MPKNLLMSKWHIKPRFRIGRKVFCRGTPLKGEKFRKAVVTAHQVILTDGGEKIAFFKSYHLSTINCLPWANDDKFEEGDVFASEEEARQECKFHQVSLPKEVWVEALGINGKGERNDDLLEDCELGTCCATISEIRDFLIRAYKQGGLTYTQVSRLRALLGMHDAADGKNVDKILRAFGLDWEKIHNQAKENKK